MNTIEPLDLSGQKPAFKIGDKVTRPSRRTAGDFIDTIDTIDEIGVIIDISDNTCRVNWPRGWRWCFNSELVLAEEAPEAEEAHIVARARRADSILDNHDVRLLVITLLKNDKVADSWLYGDIEIEYAIGEANDAQPLLHNEQRELMRRVDEINTTESASKHTACEAVERLEAELHAARIKLESL